MATSSHLTLPQQRAIETRGRILEAGCRVFARRGFEAATVKDIAREAQISMGALYHHFASKQELFAAILDDHIRADLRHFTVFPGKGGSFRELTEHIVGFWLEHFQSHQDLDPLFMEFWAQATREDWARGPVAGFFQLGRDLTHEVLRVCQEAGAVRPDLDLGTAAVLLHAAFHGIWVAQAIGPDQPDVGALVETFADLIERFAGGERDVDPAVLQSDLASALEEIGRRATQARGE